VSHFSRRDTHLARLLQSRLSDIYHEAGVSTGDQFASGSILQGLNAPFDERRYGMHMPTHAFSAYASTDDAGSAWLLTIFEALAITFASVLAGAAYSQITRGYIGDLAVFLGNGAVVVALFSGAMRGRDANRGLRRPREFESLRDLFFIWSGIFLFIGFVGFFLRLDPAYSRGAYVSFYVIGFLAVGAARAKAPDLIATYYHPRRFAGHHVLLIGAKNDPALQTLDAELDLTGCAHVTQVAIDAGHEWREHLPASLQQIQTAARAAAHGQICIAAGGFTSAQLGALLDGLQEIPRAIRLVPDAATERYLHLPTKSLGRLRAVEIQRAPLNTAQRAVKRAIDLGVSIPALIFLAPLMIAVAMWIKLDSKGPVLFRQRRLGHRGTPFDIYKFRSMRVMENGDVVTQAARNDTRVTRIGRFIRKTSIDELPQLLNVLKGEMSLVGPRPHAQAHDREYTNLIGNYELRQHVKPGITGWAQVNGFRGETTTTAQMRQRVECDLWYAKNASIALDIQILARTALEIFRQRNAY
jgi:putative colanic acid biosynthesis UDP-glucose lipid carrier transferase